MTTVTVFDPAMCCSTGVCGPTVEPQLANFEADLRWIASQGAEVTRHNLGQEPGAFAGNAAVAAILQAGGEDALPVILIDGRLKWTGHYPGRDELATAVNVRTAGPTEQMQSACCTPAEAESDACCAPDQACGAATEVTVSSVASTAQPTPAPTGGCC